MKKLLTLLAGICLAAVMIAGAAGEGPAIEEKALELAGSSLRFPAVSGMEDAELQENWEYDGEPFHFRMNFPGSWTPEKVAWATKAIQTVKNVRSVLDSYTFKGRWPHNLYVGCALYTHEATTYQVPVVVIENDWYIDELENMLLDEKGILLIVE